MAHDNFRDAYNDQWRRQYEQAFGRTERNDYTIRIINGVERKVYGLNRALWQQTKEHPEPLVLIKSGTPSYQWKDVKFFIDHTTAITKLIVAVPLIDVEEVYFLEELIDKLNMPYVTGASDQERAAKVASAIWEYLINNGLFPYPIEIY